MFKFKICSDFTEVDEVTICLVDSDTMTESCALGNFDRLTENIMAANFPLHRACRDGDVNKLSLLLSTGSCDLYEEDDIYGWSPIHWAAYFGKLQCMMHLLDHGASCDAFKDGLSQTPAHLAALGSQSHCLKWLLHCGATINRQLACLRHLINILESSSVKECDFMLAHQSQVPSHMSALSGHPLSLYWAIQASCKDSMGETPIHKAARMGSMECVSLLVSQGAKLSIKNYSGYTASHLAAMAGYLECAKYLERAEHLQHQEADTCTCLNLESNGINHQISNTHINGRMSPDEQSCFQSHPIVSTNTYHTNPYINGNGDSSFHSESISINNNHESGDCDMEMDENTNKGNCCSGLSNGYTDRYSLSTPDYLQNMMHLASKKRGREETEMETFKRARNEEYQFEHNGRGVFANEDWALSNGHSNGNCISHTVVEPETSKMHAFNQISGTFLDRSCLGEFNGNCQPSFSCLKFKDSPANFINVTSHYL